MKRTIAFASVIVCLTIASVLFIHYTNDHSECHVSTETIVSDDGRTTVTTTKHSCNEKFNL